ncbi:universal stress protein [Streptomyces sp. NPDC051987]|uniref:universal stress protein n=1 Tax=Streptomyces sp. NPDC051987 TaxID=3155808 RepID=UPI003413BAF9
MVVGTRGRGGLTGLQRGSGSQGVLHHGRCPVLVVPSVAGRAAGCRGSTWSPAGSMRPMPRRGGDRPRWKGARRRESS